MPVCALLAGACSPPDEWREWSPDDSGLRARTPCKPSTHTREVVLAGASRRMTLHTCRAVGQLYAVAWVEITSPADIAAALDALHSSALANVSAVDEQASPLSIPGATPQPAAGRWSWSGRLPDGRPVRQDAALFSRGTRVYQASVTGATIDASSTTPFFEGLRWRP
jgi:hypothetical protein